MGGQRHALAALPPGKKTDARYLGDCAGPRAGLSRCEKSRDDRDSIPGPYATNKCRDKNT